jgi:hypothetical protein
MDTTVVLPSDPHKRSRFIEDFRDLCARAESLSALAPNVADAALQAARDWAYKAAGMLAAEEAWKILLAMGPASLERALEPGARGAEARLLARVAPVFHQAKGGVHTSVLRLSQAGLDRLRALGYPYDALIAPETAALMWLQRGSAFGAAAWRARYPRRDPVLAYWVHNGIRLPEAGLCPEGLDMVETTIRALGKKGYGTMELQDAVRHKGAHIRVALALCAAGDPLGMIDTYARVFPAAWRPFIDAAFPRDPSAHQALAAAVLRTRIPDTRTLLLMASDPDTPEAILLPDPVAVAA